MPPSTKSSNVHQVDRYTFKTRWSACSTGSAICSGLALLIGAEWLREDPMLSRSGQIWSGTARASLWSRNFQLKIKESEGALKTANSNHATRAPFFKPVSPHSPERISSGSCKRVNLLNSSEMKQSGDQTVTSTSLVRMRLTSSCAGRSKS